MTFWSVVIGYFFTMLPFYTVNQACLQRICSVPTLFQAKLWVCMFPHWLKLKDCFRPQILTVFTLRIVLKWGNENNNLKNVDLSSQVTLVISPLNFLWGQNMDINRKSILMLYTCLIKAKYFLYRPIITRNNATMVFYHHSQVRSKQCPLLWVGKSIFCWSLKVLIKHFNKHFDIIKLNWIFSSTNITKDSVSSKIFVNSKSEEPN